MAFAFNPFTGCLDITFKVGGTAETNDVVMWNGTEWVAVPEGTTFLFAVSSFSDGESSPQLIGTGEWKAIGDITFTVAYTNGPATAAHIDKTAPAWTADLDLTTPFASVVNTEAVDYPAAPGSITWELHAEKGAESSNTTHVVAFYNYVYYGVTTKEDTFLEADVEGLADSVISNTKGRTVVIAPGATEYILYALPVRLGTVVFTVGGFEGGFQAPETVSVTNSAGFTEDYYVYRSTNLNLGSTTLVVS